MPKTLVKRIVGAAVGVVFALLIIFIGFWKTLLIALLAGLGWWLTGSRQIPQGVIDLFTRIFHLR